jgi:beta-phosphoglucomutase
MNERGVIFDMDGVLVDSYGPHFRSWQRLAEKHELEFTERQFAETFGQTSRAIIRRFWSDRADDKTIDAWDAEKESLYRNELRRSFPEMDGACELIRALHTDGWKLAIGSSGPPDNVKVVLECLPCGDLVQATVTGRDVEHGKPAPDVFLQAAEKLEVQPSRCVVVEDAPVGVAAACRAGMAVAALTGTADRGELSDADLVVDSLRMVTPAVLANLLAD